MPLWLDWQAVHLCESYYGFPQDLHSPHNRLLVCLVLCESACYSDYVVRRVGVLPPCEAMIVFQSSGEEEILAEQEDLLACHRRKHSALISHSDRAQ